MLIPNAVESGFRNPALSDDALDVFQKWRALSERIW